MRSRKPRNYWTLERCKESASHYTTRYEWQLGEGSAHGRAQREGWLDLCCGHMQRPINPPNYWTKERCIASAKKFDYIRAWQDAPSDGSAYRKALDNGWLPECTQHMRKLRVSHTKEDCIKSTEPFKTRSEWRENCDGEYQTALRNGWLDEVQKNLASAFRWTFEECLDTARGFSYVSEWRKANINAIIASQKYGWYENIVDALSLKHQKAPNGWWNKERCMASASVHHHKVDWKTANSSAYAKARVNGWLDDCTRHMIPLGDLRHRCIYEITSVPFGDKRIKYIGLTLAFEKRISQHSEKNGAIYRMRALGCRIESVNKLTDYLEVSEAIKMESQLIQNNNDDDSIISLNSAKGGALGGRQPKWTFELAVNTTLSYEVYTEWAKHESKAYSACQRHGWLTRIQEYIKPATRPSGYHTFERCYNIALTCKTSNEWKEKDPSSYSIAVRNGWLHKCRAHMQ